MNKWEKALLIIVFIMVGVSFGCLPEMAIRGDNLKKEVRALNLKIDFMKTELSALESLKPYLDKR